MSGGDAGPPPADGAVADARPVPRDASPDRPPWRFGPVQKDQWTAEVLGPIPAAMKRGHDRSEALFDGDFAGGLAGLTTHDESGYPTFTSWPSRQLATHQQAYVDWLFRAYQGGLRLMVMLAVNSEDMFGRGENDLGPLGAVMVQPV